MIGEAPLPGDPTALRSLPRGRHAATREVVIASQRGRLLEAMTRCAGERGYAATTVSHVVARAGVSRKTFYEHFEDRRACFMAVWEIGTASLLDAVLAAAARPGDWRARLRAVVDASLAALTAEPGFARSFLLEALTVSDDALARRAATNERLTSVLAEIHAQARAEGAGLGPVPTWALRASVGAAWELMVEQLRTHGADRLAELAPRIERVHLAALAGDYAGA